ncbi:hypothetical protein FACS1894199_04060 [Bacteroidia bacterium]|nr:hypothetical protein FACS1894199_04060 [Bacteroidia bacterium]
MLRTDAVEDFTLVLLKKIQQLPLLRELRLVGGTALALQLGHRSSVDLDFFGKIDAGHDALSEALSSIGYEFSSVQDGNSIHVFQVGGVKVDMVNYPYNWIDQPIETEGIKMACLKDIAAMKLSAITNRGTRKDFVDVAILLQHFSLKEMLDLYKQKYSDYSLLNVFRSLCYFEDAEMMPMPKMFVAISWEDMKLTIQDAVREELNNAE